MDAAIAHVVADRLFPKPVPASRNGWREGERRQRSFSDELEVRAPSVAQQSDVAPRATPGSDDEAEGIGREIDVTA